MLLHKEILKMCLPALLLLLLFAAAAAGTAAAASDCCCCICLLRLLLLQDERVARHGRFRATLVETHADAPGNPTFVHGLAGSSLAPLAVPLDTQVCNMVCDITK
jgi:hypothetical protein